MVAHRTFESECDTGLIFRPRLTLIATRLAIGAIAVMAVTGSWLHPGGDAFTTIWLIAVPLLAVVAIALLVMLGRPRAIASTQGLEVRNLIRTRRVEWNQILAVRFGRDAPWVTLDLSDGSVLQVMAIAASDGARARRDAQTLATLVLRHSG